MNIFVPCQIVLFKKNALTISCSIISIVNIKNFLVTQFPTEFFKNSASIFQTSNLKKHVQSFFFQLRHNLVPFWLILNFFAMWYVMIDERTSHTIVVQRFLLTQQEFSRPCESKNIRTRVFKRYFTIFIIIIFYQFSTLNGSLGTFMQSCSELEKMSSKRQGQSRMLLFLKRSVNFHSSFLEQQHPQFKDIVIPKGNPESSLQE